MASRCHEDYPDIASKKFTTRSHEIFSRIYLVNLAFEIVILSRSPPSLSIFDYERWWQRYIWKYLGSEIVGFPRRSRRLDRNEYGSKRVWFSCFRFPFRSRVECHEPAKLAFLPISLFNADEQVLPLIFSFFFSRDRFAFRVGLYGYLKFFRIRNNSPVKWPSKIYFIPFTSIGTACKFSEYCSICYRWWVIQRCSECTYFYRPKSRSAVFIFDDETVSSTYPISFVFRGFAFPLWSDHSRFKMKSRFPDDLSRALRHVEIVSPPIFFSSSSFSFFLFFTNEN